MDANEQQKDTININHLIKEVVDSFQLRAEQSGMKIDFDYEDEEMMVKQNHKIYLLFCII